MGFIWAVMDDGPLIEPDQQPTVRPWACAHALPLKLQCELLRCQVDRDTVPKKKKNDRDTARMRVNANEMTVIKSQRLFISYFRFHICQLCRAHLPWTGPSHCCCGALFQDGFAFSVVRSPYRLVATRARGCKILFNHSCVFFLTCPPSQVTSLGDYPDVFSQIFRRGYWIQR
jgi:hypothetical protein